MASNNVGELRRSAVVMTFGPGSIVDMRADNSPVSGVHLGLEDWDKEAPLIGVLENQKIYERRLCKKLGKKYFRLPPVILPSQFQNQKSDNFSHSLVIRRFPAWLQCPGCSFVREATAWSHDPGHANRFCSICTEKKPGRKKVYVVPVRFVTACENGHLDEFPWHFWLGHKDSCSLAKRDLKMFSRGPGLGGLIIQCQECKKERSLENSFRKKALIGLKCNGRRPWLSKDEVDCECSGENGRYRVLQRGASNLYYPIFETALDIPPFTESVQNILNDRWDDLVNIEDREDRIKWIGMSAVLMDAAARANLTAVQLNRSFETALVKVNSIKDTDIRHDEFSAFTQSPISKSFEFEKYPVRIPEKFKSHFDYVSRVARLREVRVLTGFTRINPPSEESVELGNYSPLSEDENGDWLPAIEIRGEGIFLAFSERNLLAWSHRDAVVKRLAKLQSQYSLDFVERNPGKTPSMIMSPRRLMLHSFSHLVMKQLTLECGYSSAALRERLYIDDHDTGICGVLIYTGTSDSDGTLGGLQSRASENILEASLIGAINSARWCSSDPLCISGDLASPDSYSIASCHGCLLLPETACEFHNNYLDRALIVGMPEDASIGFFSENQ